MALRYTNWHLASVVFNSYHYFSYWMTNHFLFRHRLVVLLLSFIVLSGCDDPSQIGLDLVDSQAGETEVETIPASFIGPSDFGDLSGGTTTAGSFRALFGKVVDPVAGSFSMTGYVDFVNSTNVNSAFRAAPVAFADLEFNIDYAHGDTLTAVSVDLFEIGSDWVPNNARSDTFLVAQTLVTRAIVNPKKGKFRIPLPSSWVTSHDSALRSANFVDEFHGFALRATAGNAIIGVHFSGSSMRASSVPGDTVSFSMSKVLSVSSFVNGSENQTLATLRDGAAETLALRFPIENTDFGQAAFHRVIVRLNVENVNSLYPANFAHKAPTRVGLRAVAIDNSTRLDLVVADISPEGTVTFDSSILANVVQSSNLGNSGLDRFELYFPVESSTVGIVAFKKGLPATFGPRAVITYTSLN